MGVCEDPAYICNEDTKTAVIGGTTTFVYSINKNRQSFLIFGGNEIVLNSRVRVMSYSNSESWNRTGHRWIGVSDGFGITYFECYSTGPSSEFARISDKYDTVDTEVLYADLRNDIIIYKETTKSMTYADTRNFTIPLATSYDDAHAYPFIFETVPISITERLIYAKAGMKEVLQETQTVSGYPDDINLLMPLFSPGTNPRPAPFTLPSLPPYRMEGKTYWAHLVDWYYPIAHWAEDGDLFLYYPPWIKILGVDNDLDVKEATNRYAQSTGGGNPATVESDLNLNTSQVFEGSVAVGVDKDIFMSLAVTGPSGSKSYINRLNGVPQAITEVFSPIGAAYYPVAPIKITIKKEVKV